MPRPRQPGLTENELDVMKVLWSKGPLKVGDILEHIKRKPKPAYTSLLTLVQAMEKKGYLGHEKDGKAFIYSPFLKEKNFLSSEVKRLSTRLFGGSVASLVMNLVQDKQLSKNEIEEIRKLLEDK